MTIELLGLWPKSVLKKMLLNRWLWEREKEREREREREYHSLTKEIMHMHLLSRSTEVNTGTLSPNAFLAAPPVVVRSVPPSASEVLKMALFERPRLGTVAPRGRSSEACKMGMNYGKWESDLLQWLYNLCCSRTYHCKVHLRNSLQISNKISWSFKYSHYLNVYVREIISMM